MALKLCFICKQMKDNCSLTGRVYVCDECMVEEHKKATAERKEKEKEIKSKE